MTEEPASLNFDFFLTEPKTWVAVSFILFFVFFGKKMFGFMFKALDSRSAKIAAELAEARRLREEATAALAAYQQKYNECMQEAETILAAARRDAERLVKQAETDLKSLLEARTRMAQEKIAQAEQQAVEEVQNHVVDITIAAAKSLIADNLGKLRNDELVRAAISDLERKVH